MSGHKLPEHVSATCLPGAGIKGVCDRCTAPLAKGRRRWCSDECSWAYTVDHVFRFARNEALNRDGDRCINGCETSEFIWLEVDHIEAAAGRHSVHACVHHVDNLRTLCHPCHVKRTTEQRREQRAAASAH